MTTSDASPRSLVSLKTLSLGLILVGVVADLWTKAVMERRLDMDPKPGGGPFGREEVIPGFLAWEGTYNEGVTFGLFGGQTNGIMLFTAIATIALVIWLIATRRRSLLLHVGLGMVLAGAIGNLYDRLQWQKVRDFILVYVGDFKWPNFNVADSLIVVGVIVILVEELFVRPKDAPEAREGTTGAP